jgi:hypothetical protein
MPNWQLYAFAGGLIFQTALLVAAIRSNIRDTNGLGRKYRRMYAEMLVQASGDPEAVKRLAKLLGE